MPVRGGNGARFRRKCIADHAPPLPDEVARGVHGSFTGESGRGARFGAIGRSFTGEVALGRCGEHFATALAGAGSPRRAGGRGLSRLVSAQATRSGRRGADPGLRRAKRVRPGLGSPDDPSGVRHRASPRPHNGRRHRASARPRNGWRLHASAFSGTFHRVDQVPSPTRLLQVLFPRNSFRIKAPLYLPTTRKAETTWFLAST